MAALQRAKAWLYDLVAHNYAEQLRIHRAVQRKKMGVEQEDQPYPGAVANSNNPTTVVNHMASGWTKGAVVGTLLALAGAGGTVAALRQPAAATLPAKAEDRPAAAAPVTPAVPPAKDGAWDAVYEELQPDGTWRIIKKERLK